MNFDPEKLISLYFLDHTAMTESSPNGSRPMWSM
jgi:hypothetical protein